MYYQIKKLKNKIQYLEDLLLRSRNRYEQEELTQKLRMLRVTLYELERDGA